MEESHLNRQEEEEEKEEGELEDGELEDEEEEPQLQEGDGDQKLAEHEAAIIQGSSPSIAHSHHHYHEEDKEGAKDGEEGAEEDPFMEGEHKEEEGRKGKSGKEEKKRKHKDDDEEKERRRKKKKKRRHVSSEEEEDEASPVPKFHRKMMPQPFDGNMGFDAMLQQEMYLRGRSPPPGMVPFGPPPGAFGPPHPMFRGHPMSDYDSYESGSDSERHGRRRRRRHRRSRSRSRSPSCKNEAICMYYMQGSCKRGKGCPYSHDIQPQRKMELCKFYMMDCCAKKEKCLYMHKDFPCKYYHTGLRCKLASKCKFSHGQLADSAKQILLKHIELAPKDILGDFPRLTKEAAQLVVDITAAHRRFEPLNVENLPGIMDMKGRGFKYVDKAIRAMERRHEKSLKEQEEHDREEGLSRLDVSGGLDDQHHQQQHHDQQQHHHHQQVSKEEKIKHNREEQEGIASPRHSNSPTHISEVMNGEGQQPSPGQGGNSSHLGPNPNPGRNLGRFMAGMPQKQRELFQRIQQQHSVHDDQDDGTGETGEVEESSAGTSNVNWYSSDEEGDGSSPTKSHSQGTVQSSNLSPSRTPPLPHQDTSPSHGSLTPPGRPGSSQANSASSTSPKTPFSNINLAKINISSDLASVLSALKSQNAANANRSSDDTGRGQMAQSPRKRDPREISRELSQDMSRDPREISRDLRDMGDQRDLSKNQSHGSRDPRGGSQGMKMDSDYSPNSWMRDQQSMGGRWDSHREIEPQKEGRSLRESFPETRESGDVDSRQRTGDVDLRVLPGIEENRPQGPEVKGLHQDTDMRISSEPSIYDVDLRQLGLPTTFKESDEDPNSLPFKVPVHTPAKEIVASISSHSPMYYQLVKVCIPKPNFSNLKINKDDPKILEDPRLRKMLRRNSTEDTSNRSPKTPSRYELDGPMSPPPYTANVKSEPSKFSESESRDPRMSGSRDPRGEPRGDPRSESRFEPRGDPRMGTRNDPRMGGRGDPRADSRDPRAEQMSDMRNQDPRMFGGGNGGGMMDGGGMPFNNMGGGPMGGVMPPRNADPRGRPGLLGPAPMPFPGGVPHGMGPRMPPFMMGQMGPGPNGGFYPDDGEMMGGGGYPQGGPGWGGRMTSNDPRLKRDIGDGRSYTPPPVS